MQMEYVLRDHLGNTRVTFSDADNNGVVTKDDIKQINSFYSFGLNMEGNFNGAEGNNKYGYNGKEWNDDFGWGVNDYGARFYDPAIGRWGAVDPLAIKYNYVAPYCYVGNRPSVIIDPDGMQWATAADEQKAGTIKDRIKTEMTKTFDKMNNLTALIVTSTDEKEKKELDDQREELRSNYKELNNAKKEIDEITTSEQTFTFSGGSANANHGSTIFTNGQNEIGTNKGQTVLQIKMTFPSGNMGLTLHELKHAYQMMKGIIVPEADGKKFKNIYPGGYDSFLKAEAESYRRQYSIDPSSMPPSGSPLNPVKPNSINGVTQKYIQGIYQISVINNTIYIYSEDHVKKH
jgi:RHS repeat-associated protein